MAREARARENIYIDMHAIQIESILLNTRFFSQSRFSVNTRLQNSPYFCVFKYGRAVKQKVWNEAENIERDWGETLKIRLRQVRRARFARAILFRHALPISLLILRKKLTVLQSKYKFGKNTDSYLKEFTRRGIEK